VKPNATIQSFFNGTAKVKNKKQQVPCPMCERIVDLDKINNHMDSQECIKNENVKVVTNDVRDSLCSDENKVYASEKRKSCEEGMADKAESKKLRTDSSLKEETSEDIFNDEDDAIIEELFSDSQTSSASSQQSISSQGSQSQTIKLSKSISYNPSQFGGLHNLSPSPEAKVIHSGTKRAVEKYRKTPTKEKRNLFGGPLPEMPQHDPFTPRKRLNPDYIPYYVTNFEYVIGCVIDCTQDKNLFNDDELDVIDKYRALSLEARKLYVRLFNRKHAWISEDKIRYDEIPDVQKTAKELIQNKLVQSKEELNNLADVLHLISAADIKTIARDFNCSSKSSNKTDITQELLKMSKRKNGFFQTANTLESKIINKGKCLVGPCYRLDPESRSPLLRVLCLWGLNSWWESREEGATPSTLTSILLTNQGHVTYPCYTINRVANIFRHREDLIRFEESIKIEDKIEQAVINKDFEAGYLVYKSILEIYNSFDNEYKDHVCSLPVFLQRFSALAVVMAGLNKAVDMLEKMKKHGEAVELLRKLLASTVLDRYRGFWYERLSLDLDSHLKQPEAALAVVETALNDPKVRAGRRLTLCQRAVKICGMKKYNLSDQMSRFTNLDSWDCPSPDDLPSVFITGKMINREGLHGKSVFQVPDISDSSVMTYCSVEEFCINHYSSLGLHEGLHGEGAVFNSLLGLLFWDIIYSDVPDAFRDPGQALPLDWDSDHFYLARKDRIDVRLAELISMERDEMCSEVVVAWTTHLDVVSLVNWNMFNSEERVRSLVSCFDPVSLAAVLERLVKDHRSTRSGLPDLTVWDSGRGQLKCVEVKGPGDKLSTKQILWVRFLNSVGVDTEVCHVLPLGSLGGRVRSPGKRNVKKSPVGKELFAEPSEQNDFKKSRTERKKGKKQKRVDENENAAPAKNSRKKRKTDKVDSDEDFCL